MKIWVIKTPDGNYIGDKGVSVPFGYSRIFKGEKSAKDFISKNSVKKANLIGSQPECVNISERRAMAFNEARELLSLKDENFLDFSVKHKVVARSKYGFLNSKYNGYNSLEDRFSSDVRRGYMGKNLLDLLLCMQIHKGFVTIPDGYMISTWVRLGYYADEAEATSKFNELVDIFEGNGMEICFLA